MSKGGTTCPKLSIFCNLCQFTKIYVSNFVQSRFSNFVFWGYQDNFGPAYLFIISFYENILSVKKHQNTK